MSVVVLSVWLLWAMEPTKMFPGGMMWSWCDGAGFIHGNFFRKVRGLGQIHGVFFYPIGGGGIAAFSGERR